ncbi:hypothetical protein AKO1_006916 [Acrasis kona]|uniref:Protein kinase domain-containing protein n=1 Tax=Acrasis kona TaxID=1008807 RepID=A0AAW2YVX9_9EUKA
MEVDKTSLKVTRKLTLDENYHFFCSQNIKATCTPSIVMTNEKLHIHYYNNQLLHHLTITQDFVKRNHFQRPHPDSFSLFTTADAKKLFSTSSQRLWHHTGIIRTLLLDLSNEVTLGCTAGPSRRGLIFDEFCIERITSNLIASCPLTPKTTNIIYGGEEGGLYRIQIQEDMYYFTTFLARLSQGKNIDMVTDGYNVYVMTCNDVIVKIVVDSMNVVGMLSMGGLKSSSYRLFFNQHMNELYVVGYDLMVVVDPSDMSVKNRFVTGVQDRLKVLYCASQFEVLHCCLSLFANSTVSSQFHHFVHNATSGEFSTFPGAQYDISVDNNILTHVTQDHQVYYYDGQYVWRSPVRAPTVSQKDWLTSVVEVKRHLQTFEQIKTMVVVNQSLYLSSSKRFIFIFDLNGVLDGTKVKRIDSGLQYNVATFDLRKHLMFYTSSEASIEVFDSFTPPHNNTNIPQDNKIRNVLLGVSGLIILVSCIVIIPLAIVICNQQLRILKRKKIGKDLEKPEESTLLLGISTSPTPTPHKSCQYLNARSWWIDYKDLQFDKRIAEGSAGILYKGKWRGSDVAIKMIKVNLVDEDEEDAEDEEARFEQEASILSSLRHPNIVLYMGVAVDDNRSNRFIVTEYMPQGSLDQVLYKDLKNRKIYTFGEKIKILINICQGMIYLHNLQTPILHRDIKPQNILLGQNKTDIKLCDFGVSKMMSFNTMTNISYGTIQYTSPSILKRDKYYSEKCDTFSFGIIMHELFFVLEPYLEEIENGNYFKLGMDVINGKRPSIPFDENGDEQNIEKFFWESHKKGVSYNTHSIVLATQMYIHLMKECWQDEEPKRPSFSEILSRLNSIQYAVLLT